MILKEQKITYQMRHDSLDNDFEEKDPLKGMFWSGLMIVFTPLLLGDKIPMFASLLLYACGTLQIWVGLK